MCLQDAVSHVNISLMTSANVVSKSSMPMITRLVVIHHASTTMEKFEKCKQSRIRFPYPSHHRHTQTYLYRIIDPHHIIILG
jgi:hypothetical protein